MKQLYLLPALLTLICSCSDDPKGGEKEEEKPDNSPRTVSVIDFDPAPGQFINEIPEFEQGDDYKKILAKAQTSFDNGEEISLGAWGGSITLKFSKPLTIAKSGYDFRVLGNSYITGGSDDTSWYGSSEPGIIEVMQDVNKNGKPDDTWYTIPVPGVEVIEETVTYTADASGNVTYVTSDGTAGTLTRNAAYHTQSFWPRWIDKSTMTKTGLRLADNGTFNPATFKYEQTCYSNCADSYPNSSDKSAIAVRDARAPITAVDFVRIYTGVLQCNGPLGECSTEVCGIEFLHD